VLSYYFVKIPDLPPEAQHQSRAIDIIEYLVAEGDTVAAGTPLARVENWWAVMELDAMGPGILTKSIFRSRDPRPHWGPLRHHCL
jgi:pyruvate/2-oxoglutarate dehydrogenase complex dihydrolipoamide acyltransferase (E2) component